MKRAWKSAIVSIWAALLSAFAPIGPGSISAAMRAELRAQAPANTVRSDVGPTQVKAAATPAQQTNPPPPPPPADIPWRPRNRLERRAVLSIVRRMIRKRRIA
jgi:hypothetical protein